MLFVSAVLALLSVKVVGVYEAGNWSACCVVILCLGDAVVVLQLIKLRPDGKNVPAAGIIGELRAVGVAFSRSSL